MFFAPNAMLRRRLKTFSFDKPKQKRFNSQKDSYLLSFYVVVLCSAKSFTSKADIAVIQVFFAVHGNALQFRDVWNNLVTFQNPFGGLSGRAVVFNPGSEENGGSAIYLLNSLKKVCIILFIYYLLYSTVMCFLIHD